MKLIADGWRDYEIQVIPLDAPEVQRTESRRAFYAGAIHLFHGITTQLDPGEDPTDADLKRMDEIKAEIDGYAADMAAGRA